MVKKVFYFSLTENVYGGEQSLLTLLSGLDREEYKPMVVLPRKGRLSEELDKINVDYIVHEILEPDNKLDAIPKFLKALSFLKKNKVDLIHFNSSVYWKPMEIKAAKLLRIPIVTHCRVITKRKSPYLKNSDKIIVNSNFTASKFDFDQTKVVYNAVDLDKFDGTEDIRKDLGYDEDDILITFIGSIKKVKGIEMFLDVADGVDGGKFLVVGDTKDKDYLNKIKKRIRGNERVKYAGYRSDAENIYKSSDIIVMPSQWQEPFGRINIEAGAASKPIVSTKVGGIPEIIEDGENGFLVEKDDLDKMVKYVEKLINDEDLREKMGGKGKEIVEEKFSGKKHVNEIEKIYGGLL